MSPAIAESLTEESLILRLRSTEHDFVERKSQSDRGGWLRTAVAFANSAPIGWPAILFVGVDDEGSPQQGKEKLEDLAKSVGSVLDQAYPAIYRHVVPLHLETGSCLGVVVPGSELRPHFAGKSYIRDGPQTKEASEEQFERLIAERQSKAREILKWKGRGVALERRYMQGGFLQVSRGSATVADCNQFFVSLEDATGLSIASQRSAWIPLERINVSWETATLQLEINE